MTRVFRVGELVILQRATRQTHCNGFPAVVVGGLASRKTLDLNVNAWVTLARAYRVRVLVDGGPEYVAEPYQMRRLRGDDRHDLKKRSRKKPVPKTV